MITDKTDFLSTLDFETEIRRPRSQLWATGKSYTTPIEISRAAAEYLIRHAGIPIDFDAFHKKFKIPHDRGHILYPHDTLNWHTYLWLRKMGYDCKLFGLEVLEGTSFFLLGWPKRYMLVDKEENICWGNWAEQEQRSFNNEFWYYRGAYYTANFELIPPKIVKKYKKYFVRRSQRYYKLKWKLFFWKMLLEYLFTRKRSFLPKLKSVIKRLLKGSGEFPI